jgi:hypothetical protein
MKHTPDKLVLEDARVLVIFDGDRLSWRGAEVNRCMMDAAQIQLDIPEATKKYVLGQIDTPSKDMPKLQFYDWLTGFVQGRGVETRRVKATVEDVFQKFVDDAVSSELVYPDVAPCLEALRLDNRIAVMLDTAGPEVQQEAKNAATGLGIAHRVSRTANKAGEYHRWVKADGRIRPILSEMSVMGVEPTDYALLIDDKGMAFAGRGDERIGGFNVLRPEEYGRGDIAKAIAEMRPVRGVRVQGSLDGVAASVVAALNDRSDSTMLNVFRETH